MQIYLNGHPHQIPEQTKLLAFLRQQKEPVEEAIIEHNGRFVWPQERATLSLDEGDRIEVILPAFGG